MEKLNIPLNHTPLLKVRKLYGNAYFFQIRIIELNYFYLCGTNMHKSNTIPIFVSWFQ